MHTPLFEQDPAKAQKMHGQLAAVHYNLTEQSTLDTAVQHRAQTGVWTVVLDSSAEGELVGASIIRSGQEAYTFARLGNENWAAADDKSSFPSAHFHNLVTMATREGLQWEQHSV